ncbi:hypothetical protein O181_036141 [Austropuccinia psidii MF-1]|uniref:Integrase zinc-binding domain-containing protein n=1 Tax=Austropuccinia psidii MF-1 TaxID=1389203 RepID=A0A9Q3D3V5_9BASI|nr:hypothetical protein [Austropuccinia psidii MF-1]
MQELWDAEEEPEEIETVMKAFPPAYHQYLGVFSKVKAEKHSPHCASDHDIKLEGSLPPKVSPTKRGFHHCSNPSLPTIVKTDASDYALGAVLSQVSDLGKHPIAFDSHKLLPAELNYEIHDKELFGIVWALMRLRSFLLSLSPLLKFSPIKVHSNISYALSPHDNIYPERGEDFISKNPMNSQKIIKQDEIPASKFFAVKVDSFQNFIDSIQKELWKESQYRSILQDLGKGKPVQDSSLDPYSQLLLFKDWVVAPNYPKIQLRILQKRHNSALPGHLGQEKTLKLVKLDFHWFGMTQFVKDYVSCFQQCSRNKNIHHKKFGLLKPLPIPNGP